MIGIGEWMRARRFSSTQSFSHTADMRAPSPPRSQPVPAQGWPVVPSPHRSPTQRSATAHSELATRRRLAISPRTGALVRRSSARTHHVSQNFARNFAHPRRPLSQLPSAGSRQSQKFQPVGPLPSAFAPVVPVSAQAQHEPAQGPSPDRKGKWRGKRRPVSIRRKGGSAMARAHKASTRRRAAGGGSSACNADITRAQFTLR